VEQAVFRNLHPHRDNESQKWLLVILFSLFLHSVLVLWFSSRAPDFPEADFSEFKVGLNASEGMGDALQTSVPDIAAASELATEEAGIVTQQETVSDAMQKHALEVTDQLPPVEQALTESIELAAVVTPETSNVPDVSPPAIRDVEQSIENKVEESRPVEAVEITVASAASVDDATETAGIVADIDDVEPISDFFKPAEIQEVAEEPMMALPIEQLAAVPAPEALKADVNPDLASNDVEILEIKARDVAQQKPAPRISVAGQTGTGDDPLHPKQSPPGTLEETSESTQQIATQKDPEDLPPLVVPKAYILELKSWLSEYKKYPQQAHRLKQEGVVIVGLVIDRSGKIISHEIRRSSEHELLDQEVESMIQRAGKMPALPDDFPRESLELLIPIQFKVNSG